MFSVGIYLIHRAYGGPEEGGWWYDAGELSQEHIQYTRFFQKESGAIGYGNYLQCLCNELNKDRLPMSDVNSDGVYRAIINDGFSKYYPEKAPQYE